MPKRKFYVVWEGYQPGIYDTWEECEAQIKGFHGAKYKSFPTCEEATMAFRQGMDAEELKFYTFFSKKGRQVVNYEAFPEIRLDAIAVDGACDKTSGGNVEYQGVSVATGETIFKIGPLVGGSNNIGEFLAIVHALAYLYKQGDATTPIYSDSKTAISWIKKRESRTTLDVDNNSKLGQILLRANVWIQSHEWKNPILKWDTSQWGEIPADFGRK